MWRGINPTMYPKRNKPMRKKTNPVRTELRQYAVIVVAITASGFSSPTLSRMVNAIL
jgi:hypothetical protein